MDRASHQPWMKTVYRTLSEKPDPEILHIFQVLGNYSTKILMKKGSTIAMPLQFCLDQHCDSKVNVFAAIFTNNSAETAFGKPIWQIIVGLLGLVILAGSALLMKSNIVDGNLDIAAYDISSPHYDSQTSLMIEGIIVAVTGLLFCLAACKAAIFSPLQGRHSLECAFWWTAVAGFAPALKVIIDYSHRKLCMQVSPKEIHLQHCVNGCTEEWCEFVVHSLFFIWGTGGLVLLRCKQSLFWMWTLGLAGICLLVIFKSLVYNLIGAAVLLIGALLVINAAQMRYIAEIRIKEVVLSHNKVWDEISQNSKHAQLIKILATTILSSFAPLKKDPETGEIPSYANIIASRG